MICGVLAANVGELLAAACKAACESEAAASRSTDISVVTKLSKNVRNAIHLTI